MNVCYAANTLGNKIEVISSLQTFRCDSNKDIEDYLAKLETKLSALAKMQLPMEEEIQVAFLGYSLQERSPCRTMSQPQESGST